MITITISVKSQTSAWQQRQLGSDAAYDHDSGFLTQVPQRGSRELVKMAPREASKEGKEFAVENYYYK